MPVISPSKLGSFQNITVNNQIYLVEKFNQSQNVNVSDKPMIQGSVGTKVMDIGEIIWTTTLESVAVVGSTSNFNSIFTLLLNEWTKIIDVSKGNTPAMPLLEKASITINKDSVKCSLTFKSDSSSPFLVQRISNNDFTARIAKWYDCSLEASAGFPVGFKASSGDIAIENAEIEFDTKITPRFFIGQAQNAAFFSVDSYKISGKITVIGATDDLNDTSNIINAQPIGGLKTDGPSVFILKIGSSSINLGLSSVKTRFDKIVTAGEVNRLSFSFMSYTS